MRGIDARLAALEQANPQKQQVVMIRRSAAGLTVDLGDQGTHSQSESQTEEEFVTEMETRFADVMFIWLVSL